MSDIPNFPEFIPVSKENILEIKQAITANPPEISDLSAGNIWGYRTSLNYHVSNLDGNILIRSIPNSRIETGFPAFFLPPLGKGDTVELMKKCLPYGIFSSVPENLARIAKNAGLKISEKRDDADYIYLSHDLCALKGSNFQSKRNFANHFYENYKYEFLKITKALLAECLELQEKWCNMKKCMFFKSLEMENTAILEMFNNFEFLGLFGMLIKINNRVEAFGVAEKMSSEMVAVHIQKANTEFRGIYQALSQLFCGRELKNFKLVNWEQDVGNQGLRKSKLSYHPFRLLTKYDVFY
ncbi:MAG: hypothetical protein A3J83_04990 [Elusimicrobia bacterium RIFOXYA2_FULL_40_6]|nr:MAG: hypothetical protein A3J83_04990 [Elusimicrobia bacterium RIFOXYA2_FULL_40_6]